MEEWKRLELLFGQEQVNVLKTKTVLILGVGGVGGYVAEALARSACGTIILIDYDTVNLSNLNRQIIALHSTIGKKKVDVLKNRILDINPSCQVHTYPYYYPSEEMFSLWDHSIDFVVDACDTIKSKEAILLECIDRHIPFITSTGTGKRVDPSLLEITELEKTNADPLARILRKWKKDLAIKEKIPVLWSRELPKDTGSGEISSAIFVPASAGLLIASYVVRKLTS